jgi:hypothetical protein
MMNSRLKCGTSKRCAVVVADRVHPVQEVMGCADHLVAPVVVLAVEVDLLEPRSLAAKEITRVDSRSWDRETFC